MTRKEYAQIPYDWFDHIARQIMWEHERAVEDILCRCMFRVTCAQIEASDAIIETQIMRDLNGAAA